uniref:Uncharacterized protein n=1 Tax=viral metagenome TaxID=1070528 RepID=A0A6C0BMR6_9ZZZZ
MATSMTSSMPPPSTSRKCIRRISIPVADPDALLKQKLARVAELQRGLKILKDRMSASKRELINYFQQTPTLKNSKYVVDDYTIRYVEKKNSDGISQKLIASGLTNYFRSRGITDVSREVTAALNMIKDQRKSRTIPEIEIRSQSAHGKIENEIESE